MFHRFGQLVGALIRGNKKKLFVFSCALTLLLSCFSSLLTTTNANASAINPTTFTVDNVAIALTDPVPPASTFYTTASGNDLKQAVATSYNPYHSFSVEAVPYGTTIDGLPVAQAGSASVYRKALATTWQNQTSAPTTGPTISIFGQSVPATVYHLTTPLDLLTAQPAQIAEWVVEAGSRVWIVRDEQAVSASSNQNLAQLNGNTTLISTTLTNPTTTVKRTTTQKAAIANTASFPSWWNGNCDSNNNIGSAPVGPAYQGVEVCGPGGGTYTVFFYPGSFGVLEWQCVELSMRYMYMVDGINPYSANGNQVIANYGGSSFNTYNSGNPSNSKLQPISITSNNLNGNPIGPGDILSWNNTGPNGHTSVVTASTIDSSGNGNLTIMEENGDSSGAFTYPVANWVVTTWGYGTILGYLHQVNNTPPPPPAPDPVTRPVVAANSDGHLEAFARDTNGYI